MAWSYEQLFNGLTTADLNGQDSWSGNAIFDVTTTVPYEGAKCVSSVLESDSELTIDRSITAISAGTVYVSLKVNRTAGTRRGSFEIYSDTTLVMRVFFINNAGSVSAQMLSADAGNWFVIASGLSNDTWYRIGIEFDDSAQPDKYRCNIDNGAWSAWRTVWSTTYSTVNKIRFADQGNNGSGTGTMYYDTISGYYNYTPPASGPANLPVSTLAFMGAG